MNFSNSAMFVPIKRCNLLQNIWSSDGDPLLQPKNKIKHKSDVNKQNELRKKEWRYDLGGN